jgi:hypothetical protein
LNVAGLVANVVQIEDWKHLSFPVSMAPDDEAGRMEKEEDMDDGQDND